MPAPEETADGFFEELEPAPGEETPKPEEEAKKLKEELEREKMEKKTVEEKLEKQNKARAATRRELKEAQAELAKLKGTNPPPEPPKPTEDGEDDPEEPTTPAPPKPAEDIEKVVERKIYEKSVADSVKKRVKYRQEAEVLHATVMKLVSAGLSSGDPEEDVEKAQAILAKKETTVPSPTSIGGGFSPERGNSNKGAIELGKELGVSEEDHKKHGNGEIIL